jgi:hypothetical protein
VSAQTVYSPEVELETAITGLLTDALLTLSTSDPQTFQKGRPRAEVVCQLGADRSAHLALSDFTGLNDDVEDSWAVIVTVDVITDAIIAPHDSCRALARLKMAQLPSLINGTSLFNHVAYGPIRHMSTNMLLDSAQGLYRSTMQYSFDISVHADAWAKLNEQP